MKKLLALACVSVLMLAPACCRRGPCDPCGEKKCNPLDTFNGTEQCVDLCPPEADCRETCPPKVTCTTEEVPVKLFRKRKTCVATMVGPVESTCETDVVKCPDIEGGEAQQEDGVLVSKKRSRQMMRKASSSSRRSRRAAAPEEK